jgi:hypothetical protein
VRSPPKVDVEIEPVIRQPWFYAAPSNRRLAKLNQTKCLHPSQSSPQIPRARPDKTASSEMNAGLLHAISSKNIWFLSESTCAKDAIDVNQTLGSSFTPPTAGTPPPSG